MKLYLYEMHADKRYLAKTENNGFLTPLYNSDESSDGAVDAVMLDETSVINPTFKISRSHYWKRCNYVWSEDTLRYYYVTDVILAKGYVLIQCHVDVLNTFRTKIKNKNVILKRASKWNTYTGAAYNYNKYLNDDKFKAYAGEQNRIIAFDEDKGFQNKTTEFVLCVVGNTNTQPEPEPENNNQQGG